MIRTEQIFFRIGAFQLHGLSLDIASGQYFVLLGPPGSGKSVLLECLCGLKRVDSGRIFIDGRDVTFLEPRARKVGYVPQDYALFPHLTVEQNITFGLRVHGCKREDVIRRVSQTAGLLGIEHLSSRRIGGLSGGEAQRVALARALVLQPRVLLLDEPVCALDEVTRQEVCSEVFRVQRHLGLTVVHVSHNLEEAFSVADQAAILHQGVLEQVGSLADLLRRPNSKFVARFLRSENVFSGRAVGPGLGQQRTRVRIGDVELQVPGEHHGEVTLVIRPEGVLIRPCSNGCRKGENEIHVRLARWRSYGSYIRVELDGTFALVAHLTGAAFDELKIEHQTTLLAVLSPENIHVLPG
jgi:ABC-type Fe3+/spermidine/putrescine transport system ATPase subunit